MAAPTGHMATRSCPINVNTASFSRHASAGLFFFNCVQKAYDSDLAVCTICSKKKSNIISISVLQIRRDKRGNLGIIFHNIPLKRMLRLVETVLKRGHNICFSLRNKKKYLNYHQYPLLSGGLAYAPYGLYGGKLLPQNLEMQIPELPWKPNVYFLYFLGNNTAQSFSSNVLQYV